MLSVGISAMTVLRPREAISRSSSSLEEIYSTNLSKMTCNCLSFMIFTSMPRLCVKSIWSGETSDREIDGWELTISRSYS